MKIKALVIELGVKNLDKMKKHLNPSNTELRYASSFLDVVDIIHLDTAHVIFLSDFRGVKSTVSYLKMFKTINPVFNLVILSNDRNVTDELRSYYIQRGAEAVISCYDLVTLEKAFAGQYSRLINDNQLMFEWSPCTKKAIRYLKNNYQVASNLINLLFENINYSASNVNHFVKKDTGLSLTDWIQKLRVNGAKELLKNTEFPVKKVSDHVGYRSIQGFIKAFKKFTGKTPSDFRRECI